MVRQLHYTLACVNVADSQQINSRWAAFLVLKVLTSVIVRFWRCSRETGIGFDREIIGVVRVQRDTVEIRSAR